MLNKKGGRATIAGLLFIELLWANLGMLPVLGILVASVRMNLKVTQMTGTVSARFFKDKTSETPSAGPVTFLSNLLSVNRRSVAWDRHSQFQVIGLMLLIGSATPRGILTLWDSLRILLPWTCADLTTLDAAGILLPFPWPPTAEFTAFVILSVLTLSLIAGNSSTSGTTARFEMAVFAIAVLIAGSAAANLGYVAAFFMVWTLELVGSIPRPEIVRETSRATDFSPTFGRLLPIGLALFAATFGMGYWPDTPSRLGWGLAPQIETALLEQTMIELNLEGTAYCSGMPESGMLAWLRPGTLRPTDAPTRALLSGRLRDHVRIGWDLQHGWRDRHRRTDGSWGGWWIPLFERHVRLLLISPEASNLIQALEPSHWKPLAIDTPGIPYGMAGDPAISHRILQIQPLLKLVDIGEWSYAQPVPAGAGSHFDLCGWLTGQHDLRNDLRQSRTLAAMDRRIAALRVLKYGLKRHNQASLRAFCSTQLSIAYHEFLATGEASRWRQAAYLESGGNFESLKRLDPSGHVVISAATNDLRKAATAYSWNDLESAKKALSVSNAASLFALSQISLEEGRPQQAAVWLKELIANFPNTAESQAGRHVLAKFSE